MKRMTKTSSKVKPKVSIHKPIERGNGMTIVIDAMSDFYRHYYKLKHVMPGSDSYAGFFGMIRGVFAHRNTFKSNDIRVVWEGSSTIRKNLKGQYKSDRKKMEGNFYEQVSDARIFLSHFFKQYYVKEYEADDLLATIASQRSKNGKKTTIISGDYDLHQMVDENTYVYHAAKKELHTLEDYNKEGIKPTSLLGLWSLEGDKSDNISGIKGLRQRPKITKLYYPHELHKKNIISDEEFYEIHYAFSNNIMGDKEGIISDNDKKKIKNSLELIYDNMNLIRLRKVDQEHYTKIEKNGDPKALIEKYKTPSLNKYLEEAV